MLKGGKKINTSSLIEQIVMASQQEIHDNIFKACTTEQLMKAYDQWSETYDHVFFHNDHNLVSLQGVKLVSSLLEEGVLKYQPFVRILDLACGTGCAGHRLKTHFGDRIEVVGIDLSPGMLSKAKARNVYARLEQSALPDMPKDLGVFDVVMCFGAFVPNHLPESVLGCFFDVAKRDTSSWLVFSVRDQLVGEMESSFAFLPAALVDKQRLLYLSPESSEVTDPVEANYYILAVNGDALRTL